jgi:DNA-binding transcriptional ArsR family regulator
MANKLIDKEDDFIITANAIKAMSHPLHPRILCALAIRELCVQDIVAQVGETQSNISQHFAILRCKNLLAAHKDATRVYYRISDTRTLKLVSMVRDVFVPHE